jgi:signal transduction histidine kinase
MSGGEQSGVSSLTRTNFAVPIDVPSQGGSVTNGEHAQADELDARPHGDLTGPRAGLPSSVIHELRTPLTSIHGYAQVLQRSLRDDPRSKNALAVVLRETTRLSAMLAELSELADVDAGDVVVAPIEIEAQQIVDGVVHEILRRDGGAHAIVMNGSAVACCNPTILSQVLFHVLTNAIRYSPPDSQIDVDVRSRGSQVEIVVADRGISVDPADARRIYEPFERGANARQAGVRGLGLGLYLARRHLAEAGGSIEHHARDDGGTIFRITVPGA